MSTATKPTPTEIQTSLEAWCNHAMEDVIPDFDTGSTEHFWLDPRSWAEQVVDVAFGAAVDDDPEAAELALTRAWGRIADEEWEQSNEREQAIRYCLRYLVNAMSEDQETASA